ncbi:MAG: 16S rRNA processing protein RimM [Ruminococcaceae bacterium]|nr:16S rRNA processing protein RimM [Oscillospiraceae bacterium]
MQLIEVGEIVNTHALKGEVKLNPWTDAPEVLEQFDTLYTKEGKAFSVEGVRYHKASVLLKLSGVNTVEAAEAMRGMVLYADRADFGELPEQTWFVTDLIGLTVIEKEQKLGVLTDVFSTGSNDVYVVKREGKRDLLIPALKSVIDEVNLVEKVMMVTLPEGLDDEV